MPTIHPTEPTLTSPEPLVDPSTEGRSVPRSGEQMQVIETIQLASVPAPQKSDATRSQSESAVLPPKE